MSHTKKYLMCSIYISCLGNNMHALPSIRGITALIKNETPQEYIIKLVNLESSQEVLIEAMSAKGGPRDFIRMSIPPELYGVTIFYAPTSKATNISAKALRSALAPGSSCVQVTLRSRIYVGEPQIEISSATNCTQLSVR